MNKMLARELDEVLGNGARSPCSGLGTETTLRAAAATLCRSTPQVVTATTVVSVLGRDDVAAVETMIADIAEEFGLESRLRVNGGSFSVRFSRPEGY